VNNHDIVNRRRLLAGSAAAGATALALGGSARAASAGPAYGRSGQPQRRFQGKPGTSGATLRWWGNNAWEITFGTTTVLIDPWVTRFPTGTYTGGTRPDTPLVTDKMIVDRYITRADLILVGHGHFDHLADVPYVATKTGAAVLGTETHVNLLQKMGAPAAQLGTVRGGEYLQYDGFTVEVFPSLHSVTGIETTKIKQVPFPGTRTGPLDGIATPMTVADLVEGGTLAYQITIGETFRILSLSTANFIEDALAGLRPDLAIVAVGGRGIHTYVDRLMNALDRPTWVLPTHWDDFDLPLDQPAKDFGALGPLREAVAAASPRTAFIQLEHLQTFTP
jgi:L-ascorbate metabolism protein UlaG (beta-lactamase superfamily)